MDAGRHDVLRRLRLDYIDTGEATIRVRHGGEGSPVVLLHGHPRTHTTWHAVAPPLAERHAVVCPDLRGYGDSSTPPTTPDHEPYSKAAIWREWADDVRGARIESGHHMAEEAPEELACVLADFLAGDRAAAR